MDSINGLVEALQNCLGLIAVESTEDEAELCGAPSTCSIIDERMMKGSSSLDRAKVIDCIEAELQAEGIGHGYPDKQENGWIYPLFAQIGDQDLHIQFVGDDHLNLVLVESSEGDV